MQQIHPEKLRRYEPPRINHKWQRNYAFVCQILMRKCIAPDLVYVRSVVANAVTHQAQENKQRGESGCYTVWSFLANRQTVAESCSLPLLKSP